MTTLTDPAVLLLSGSLLGCLGLAATETETQSTGWATFYAVLSLACLMALPLVWV